MLMHLLSAGEWLVVFLPVFLIFFVFITFTVRYLLALRHKSLPAVPDVLPILSGSSDLSGVGEVQFYVDQDTVYVVDEKIEVRHTTLSLLFS
jgi:hypothetical protein